MTSFPTEPTECILCGSTDCTVEAEGEDYVYRGSNQTVTAVRCTGCGHIYLNPRPTVDGIGVLYPETYASFSGRYTDQNGFLSRVKERVMINRFRVLLDEVPKGGAYLDLGCGDGQLLEAVKRARPDIEVHGLDWKFVPALRAKLESSGIILHESTLDDAALPERQFDLVTMNQLIEHVWNPRSCLVTVARSLSSSGKLIIATPNTDGYDRKFFRRKTWGGYYFPRHLNLFNKTSLAALAEQSGLTVIKSANLLAPVVWCYSLKAIAVLRFPRWRRLHKFCDIQNVPMLAFFAGLDAIASAAGAETSNQILITRLK